MKTFRRFDSSAKDSGLSLIEILVVVIILGILATIVAFNTSGVYKKSIIRACKNDVQIVENALTAWRNDNPNVADNQIINYLTGIDFSLRTQPNPPPLKSNLILLGYVGRLSDSSAYKLDFSPTTQSYNIWITRLPEGIQVGSGPSGCELL